jgi:type IV pilus assembly protein PilM
MGAENTTLVICTKDTVWQRSIRIGGNTFTQAIADAFQRILKPPKSSNAPLPMSKYMRQIYTAMKPVYTDLGSEIQRSLGFYSSSPQGRDKTLTSIIAVGGGMKLQGLAKYLTQTLGMQVIKPDTFERLTLASDLSNARFHENVSDFGVVYGLGTQLLGEARIHTNLLPRKIARAMAWTRKARLFTVAAGILLAVMLVSVGKAFNDRSKYQRNEPARAQIRSALAQVTEVKNQVTEEENRRGPLEEKITKEKDRFKYRQVVPQFVETVVKCLPNKDNTPSQSDLLEAFEQGNVQTVAQVPRPERKQLFVTRFAVEYAGDLETASFPQLTTSMRGLPYERGERRRSTPMAPSADILNEMMGAMGGDFGAMQPAGEAPVVSSGFTVLIEGYSPYQNVAELLDPPRAGDDPSRWGVVTRMLNLGKLYPEAPFELYKKSEIKHFELTMGLVDLENKTMPQGIGIKKTVERVPSDAAGQNTATRRSPMMMMSEYEGGMGGVNAIQFVTTEDVLFDPMTGEEISRVFDIVTQRDIDSNPEYTAKDLGRKKTTPYGEVKYINRDYWFRLKAKFVWKEAPAQPPSAQSMPGYY